jgi:phage baseplate assembly protein gpV
VEGAKTINITKDKTETIKGNHDMTAAKTTINNDVEVKGNVTVTGGDVVADGISLKLHTHIGNLGYPTGSAQ